MASLPDGWSSAMVIRAWIEPGAPPPGIRIRLTFAVAGLLADPVSTVVATPADALAVIADWLAAIPTEPEST